LKSPRGMSRVLILISRAGDRAALRDLLAEEGHDVELAEDLRRAANPIHRPDAIVADLEPATWEAKALIERASPGLAAPKVILLCARVPNGARPAGLWFLPKPVALEELRAALASDEAGIEERAA
jgi:DNA-binding response OmpR family regulator